MSIAAIVHVFYPDLWPELAECLHNLGACDLYATCPDPALGERIRRDFPAAHVIRCENRGYDVGPFLKVLQTLDLAAYDLVVKLHTKRDVTQPWVRRHGCSRLDGPHWRDHLLRFVRTPENWARTLRKFEDPSVGMVADRHVIFTRADAGGEAIYDAARNDLAVRAALHAPPDACYVAGTMFAVRARLLAPFARPPYAGETFAPGGDHTPDTRAHELERAFGLAVAAQGFRLACFRGSWRLHRVWGACRRFLFDERRSPRGHSIRICGVIVYRKLFR